MQVCRNPKARPDVVGYWGWHPTRLRARGFPLGARLTWRMIEMPFYEYRCTKCNAVFDALLSMSRREEEEHELTCPRCGAGKPKRLISTFATSSSSSSRPPGCPVPSGHGCSSGG
jgi:putative FmdB family regulatory protein